MNCPVCNIHLYKNITFKNLFLFSYHHHHKCMVLLDTFYDPVCIPIDGNQIMLEYIVEGNRNLNYDYLVFMKFGRVIEKYLTANDWSILIWDDQNHFFDVDSLTLTLIFSLANKPIIVLSAFLENSELL